MVDNEEIINQYKELPILEQVFAMDHDFVCLQRQRIDEFEQLFEKGLQSYIDSDWIGAQLSFN